jgi:hypothetical protein
MKITKKINRSTPYKLKNGKWAASVYIEVHYVEGESGVGKNPYKSKVSMKEFNLEFETKAEAKAYGEEWIKKEG